MRRRPRISATTRRKLRHRPTTELQTRENVMADIVSALYDPHWKFWRTKLLELIKENMDYLGRKGIPKNCGFHYAGKAWFVPTELRTEVREFNIMPIAEHCGDMEKNLIKVTAHLAELDIETYEVSRFMAGVLLFGSPLKTFNETLGGTLAAHIAPYVNELKEDFANAAWDATKDKAFRTYVNAHDYLIDSMCQRIMMNLISSDALKT